MTRISKKNKVKRANYSKELEVKYHEKIKKLYDCCKFFDDGDLSYGDEIAGHLYVLCCDEGNNQKSILEQLGLKSRIRLYSSTHSKKSLSLNGSPLVGFRIEGRGENKPPEIKLSSHKIEESKQFMRQEKVSFKKWWGKEHIVFIYTKPLNLLDLSKNEFDSLKRDEIIKFVRSQEGSGHFDQEISTKLALIKSNFLNVRSQQEKQSISITFRIGKQEAEETLVNFENYPRFLVRQIANEFLLSAQDLDISSARKFLHLK